MNYQERDPLDQLEASVEAMQWKHVSLSPEPSEVQALDQQLPAEWTQQLSPEIDRQEEQDQSLLDMPLEVPEGDISQNAAQAMSELGIDAQSVMQELDQAPSHDLPEIHHDYDFGR
jgi:hypothetical protein